MYNLSLPEDEVAAFPQLFAQVGGSCPVLHGPLLGAGRYSKLWWATVGWQSHVHRILPVDQWIQLDGHFRYLEHPADIYHCFESQPKNRSGKWKLIKRDFSVLIMFSCLTIHYCLPFSEPHFGLLDFTLFLHTYPVWKLISGHLSWVFITVKTMFDMLSWCIVIQSGFGSDA